MQSHARVSASTKTTRPNCERHVRMGVRKKGGGRGGGDRACPCLAEYEMREISIFATRAISGQRYHDNTPAAAATDLLQLVERERFFLRDSVPLSTCEPARCRREERRERERGETLQFPSIATQQQQRSKLWRLVKPRRHKSRERRIVVSRWYAFFLLQEVVNAHKATKTRSLFFSVSLPPALVDSVSSTL